MAEKQGGEKCAGGVIRFLEVSRSENEEEATSEGIMAKNFSELLS